MEGRTKLGKGLGKLWRPIQIYIFLVMTVSHVHTNIKTSQIVCFKYGYCSSVIVK